ncbi:MAG TPA: hypothetical protein VFT64_09285 [Rickettsiales bacterium]|nr:hypothetical protein [Rickettsiales bacterium]
MDKIDQDHPVVHDEASKSAAALPMRKEIEVDAPSDIPKKSIENTIGGRITNFLNFYVIGFGLNSSLSLGITYGMNPRPGVKKFKENIVQAIEKTFGGTNKTNLTDSIRSSVEISFMMIAGMIATTIMTPLVKHREEIAYKINKMLKKDTDILPESMHKDPEPRSIEEKIELEIHKRVKNHSAWDLWGARFATLGAIFAGDYLVNRSSRILEARDKPSVDTLSWKLGTKIYDVIPQKWSAGWNHWFSSHGASLNDIKTGMADHFGRLEKHGNPDGSFNEDRTVVAEQTRLVTKELGWTLILSGFVDKLTSSFRESRIARQEEKVLKDIMKDGLVPEGYKVVMDNSTRVRLERTGPEATGAQPKKQWAASEKPASHMETVDKNRTTASEQHTLGI